jgi:5-formyltetrahydrofolate cyclo-ligase
MNVKKELRQRLRAVLASIGPEQRHSRSNQACRLLTEQPEYRRAEVLMVFLSLPTEVETVGLVLQAWEDRKRVLAPQVSWEQRRMIPVEIHSLAQDVAQPAAEPFQPVEGTPFPVEYIDLVIVPGLAFDLLGNRLGRGRGFYDRFLALPDLQAVSCGLAFEDQVVPTLPIGPGDMQVDMLVTDQKVRRFGRA